jgi:hypothetical protein
LTAAARGSYHRPVSGATARYVRYAAVMAACGPLVAGCSRGANTPEKAGIAATYDSKTGKLAELAYDSNHNGKVDTWTEMNGTHPVRTRIDRNEDGKIDRWEYYGDHSDLVKVGLSRADTGKPDTWVFAGADGKTRRIEISSAADEMKIDRWEHYAGEAIATAEEDTNHDGRVDKWETYNAGTLATVSFDEDGDGKPDRRLSYVEGSLSAIDSDPDGVGTFRKHVIVEH